MSGSSTENPSISALQQSVRDCVRSITPVEELHKRTQATKRARTCTLDGSSTAGGLSASAHTSTSASASLPNRLRTTAARISSVDDQKLLPFSSLSPLPPSPPPRKALVRNRDARSQPQALHHSRHSFLNFATYNHRLEALEAKHEVLQERVSLLESSNTTLRTEINFLRGELKRVDAVLGNTPVDISLPSGCYRLVNALYKSSLYFPVKPNQPSRSVLTTYLGDGSHIDLWEIERSQDDDSRYTIQDLGSHLYANAWKFSGPGDKIVGTSEEREFHIVPTGIADRYIICSTDSPNLLWTLNDCEQGSEVILTENSQDLRQQWILEGNRDESPL